MNDMSRSLEIEYAAAEVLAAFWEHQAYLMVGGHEPTRVKEATDALANALQRARQPQAA